MNDLQVPSLTQLPTTPRIGNTKQPDFVIFVGSLRNASMFRPDGKKLGFVKGLFKTNVVEDIEYLDNEISGGILTSVVRMQHKLKKLNHSSILSAHCGRE